MCVTRFTICTQFLDTAWLLIILIVTSTGQQCMCVIQRQKVDSLLLLRPFSLARITFMSAQLQVLFKFLRLPLTSCNLPHIWLMSFAMDLAVLCDMCRWKWHQWMPLVVFSVDVDYACHFMATDQPPPSHPIEVPLASRWIHLYLV